MPQFIKATAISEKNYHIIQILQEKTKSQK